MRFLYNNKFIDATVTSSSENANYVLTNLQDTRLSRYFRTTADSNQWVLIALASTTASYFCILNHNISSGATIKIQGNDTDSWGSPSLDLSITYDAGTIVKNFTEATYNYWRFTVDDSSNPDNYIQVGTLYLGTFIEPEGGALDTPINYRTASQQTISDSGQLYGDERYDFRVPKFKFPDVTEADYILLRTMWLDVKNIEPVIILMWEDELNINPPLYCAINTQDLPVTARAKKVIPYEINIDTMEVF